MACDCSSDTGEAAAVPKIAGAVELAVEGMTCNNCARHVSEALRKVPGVGQVQVDLGGARASVRWAAGAVGDAAALVAAVQGAGFGAAEVRTDVDGEAPGVSPLAAWRFNVLFGALLTAPLVAGEWLFGWGHSDGFKWVGFALSAPVMFVCGRSFFQGAWRQLRRGASNMDTLVSLGSSAAFGFSVWGLLTGYAGHLYFMEAAAIVTLISTGHWLEALASARADGALRALLHLAPERAARVGADGREVEVPVATLIPGNLVRLRPGDRVPTDGEVAEGESTVDEAMLTGESLPVEKAPGDRVYAGTSMLNGHLLLRVGAVGQSTALAQIIAVVQRAQNSRATVQRLADRISSVFVPGVVLIAIGTALWWGLGYDSARRVAEPLIGWLPHAHLPATPLAAALIHAIAVLIVACPCAMGLATPVAIMAGANAAARRGILIRDSQALEKSGTLTAIAFDKTGTLTQGRLAVGGAESLLEESPPYSFASAVLGLAQGSHHPLSRAAANWARQPEVEALTVYGWQEVRGNGLQATWSGTTLRLGSIRWLRECGVDVGPADVFLKRWTSVGATVLGFADGGMLRGLLALRDELKPHAADVVRGLGDRGLKVFLLTGDHKATGDAVAQAAGVRPECVMAEVRPEQKAEAIERLQRQGERVAFVGDGINDAPALKQANLGIAVSRASDVAREAADIILLKTDIQAIPEAVGLAQATLRTIRQNLFWAFFYNAAAIPLAALGLMSPVICALAMGLSDLIVIGNALRLSRWRLR